ncbi:Oidioi.mRNA.OKI2018_I69.PAR.g9710.t1.cds [Oikopleura dioica]|uniref:Oidioi.mRNA.OKI2018_I69.PAR.g9710.t1.cds n=1 Tax=Oikopleura dioica TaxID=34765 RepID=A0ABN7RUL8_OIKDI|nr:Oidioi.mRNA.OKI2018_I69.PAR.g9710.t1.cds [Oikopleura dioica]
MAVMYRYTVTVTETVNPYAMMLKSILIVVTAFMAMELIMNIIDSLMEDKKEKRKGEENEKCEKNYKC